MEQTCCSSRNRDRALRKVFNASSSCVTSAKWGTLAAVSISCCSLRSLSAKSASLPGPRRDRLPPHSITSLTWAKLESFLEAWPSSCFWSSGLVLPVVLLLTSSRAWIHPSPGATLSTLGQRPHLLSCLAA